MTAHNGHTDAPNNAQNRERPSPVAAIDIVARAILYDAAQNIEWDDYPDIGEHDWQRVIDRVDELAPHPDGFHDAYEVLEARADGQEAS